MKKESVSIETIRNDIKKYCAYDLNRLWFPFIVTFLWVVA